MHRRNQKRVDRFAISATLLALCQLATHGALPTPILDLPFSEGTGVTTANAGSLRGSGDFVQANELPTFSTNVPSGPFAPAGNSASVDFGVIAAGQGGRAIDFTTGTDGTLGPLSAFTLSGWLNPRDLAIGAGGNRILFALESGNGPGVDLVHLANGSLRIGINQWPDGANGGGPSSSSGRLRANAQAAATNWVFFAVSYDSQLSSQQLKYYFGNGQALASLDSAHNYRGGIAATEGRVEFTGTPTIGNFSPIVAARTAAGPTASRVFRGVLDEIKVYDTALNLGEIQSVQINGAVPVAPIVIQQQPVSRTVFEGERVTLQVRVTGSAPFAYQWQRNGVNISSATNEIYLIESPILADNGATFRALVSNSAGSTNTQSATLTVIEETGHKVSLSFSDSGATTTNRGNLGGAGRLVQANGLPIVSANVPSGPFAPTQNLSSMNFGPIAPGQGSRAIDFTNHFGNTLGPMNGFTVSGWLNSVDLEDGPGGNRIAFALSSPNGPGFDLVQLDDGSLQLGVNQWPDGTPARSAPIVTADPAAGSGNWVFFAVTYDGTRDSDNVSFYVGKPDQVAQLESTATYSRGPILTSGALTVGNFGSVVGARTETGPNSRVFRGLIDELNVFNKVLTLGEVQNQQKAAAYRPTQVEPIQITQPPADLTVFEGQPASFSVTFSGTPPVNIQWQKNGANLSGETNQALNIPAALADNGSQFRVLVSNSAGSATSQVARLTVRADTGRKVALSFSESSGTSTANSGDLAGSGLFVSQNNFPTFSTNVPAGTLAPSNNRSSVDFGTIQDGEGGRAIDFTNSFGSTLGSFDRFTVTGWLNSRDLRAGSGGNRIVFGLAAPNGPGLDLVQMNDGSLQLGVNQWPDNTPARSSAGLITEDPEAGANNWVFFAVTYDGTQESGNVQYYIGNAAQAAQLDAGALDYNRGRIQTSGGLTVGNFGSNVTARTAAGPSSSRVFRGLIDEIQIFNKVLTSQEIQNVQKAAMQSGGPEAPSLSIGRTANQLAISWDSSASFQLQSTDRLLNAIWSNVAGTVEENGTRRTVRVPVSAGTRFFRLISL